MYAPTAIACCVFLPLLAHSMDTTSSDPPHPGPPPRPEHREDSITEWETVPTVPDHPNEWEMVENPRPNHDDDSTVARTHDFIVLGNPAEDRAKRDMAGIDGSSGSVCGGPDSPNPVAQRQDQGLRIQSNRRRPVHRHNAEKDPGSMQQRELSGSRSSRGAKRSGDSKNPNRI
jgi:hypothetical protein